MMKMTRFLQYLEFSGKFRKTLLYKKYIKVYGFDYYTYWF